MNYLSSQKQTEFAWMGGWVDGQCVSVCACTQNIECMLELASIEHKIRTNQVKWFGHVQ